MMAQRMPSQRQVESGSLWGARALRRDRLAGTIRGLGAFLFQRSASVSVRIEVLEDFLARVHAALAVDALDVAVGGGGGDEQLFGHLLLCVTQRVKGEHVHLAAGEQEVLAMRSTLRRMERTARPWRAWERDRGWLQGGRG